MVPDRVLSLPVDQLKVQARVAVRLFPDIPAMMEHFARSMADKVRENNEASQPTRPIRRRLSACYVHNRESDADHSGPVDAQCRTSARGGSQA